MMTPPYSHGNPSPASLGHQALHEETVIDNVLPPSLPTSSDEEIALILEDFAMGNRINRHRAALELLPEAASSIEFNSRDIWSSLPRSIEAGLQSLPTPPPTSKHLPFSLSEFHPLLLFVDPSSSIIPKLVSILPDESRSRDLIQFYFDRIAWYTKIFHYPSFMVEANEVLRHISLFRSCSSGNDKSGESALSHISLPFLSTLFMVICLGLHLIEPEICQRLSIGNQEAATLSKKLYSAAQACLWVDNFESNHSLESVQCLILMGVYQQNLDDADSQWALLGSAIKIAQNLGLSRLGSESENRIYSHPWKSIVRRETARRVWWNLIFNDWSHAVTHNSAYSIHPSQNFTGPPANINDADLVEGRELQPNSQQYTEMTFSLTRFRFVEVYREIVDNNNLNTMYALYPELGSANARGYSFVLETDARLAAMLDRIPSQFQHTESSIRQHPIKQETMGVQEMETLLALIMGETRRMRLHRPYLYRGYNDRKYARSTEQCINSARAILHYLKSTPEQSAIFLKWWLVMFYGFGAAVVLFIDLCHLRSENPSAVESRRVELQEALNLFKITQNPTPVSQNAIALLEGMLAVGENRSSRKRGADGNLPMERIAKRIMVDATSVAPSPAMEVQANGRVNDLAKPERRIPYDPASVGMGRSHPHSHSHPQPSHTHPRSDHHLRHTHTQPNSSTPQWLQGAFSASPSDWNALGLEQSAQSFFGPEFDEATINEIGQLLWNSDSDSAVNNPSAKAVTSAPNWGT
ncbi:hypothetical protein V5O48_012854 [Marasmius crinis-equi]|uniref:Xylanolytic transcriptional activator regulatory domain-containing protein n=1 Tax=Marasmius crinis-equi TaxID=585013 RepID=A0ABR3F1Q6_9AGAR